MGGSGGNRKEFKHSYRPHLGNTMELKTVRKYKFLLLGIWVLFQRLNRPVPYDIISVTCYSVIQWKSSLLENHLSQSTALEKISILTILLTES